MSDAKSKATEPLDINKYLVLRESPKYVQTYMVTAYSEVELGQWDVHGACHVSFEYIDDVNEMLLNAVQGLVSESVEQVELTNSTIGYYLEEEAGSFPLVITGNKIRYFMKGESASGVFKSPNWKHLPESFMLSFIETIHGDALYKSNQDLWTLQCENNKQAFKVDLMAHYNINESMFSFLVKDMQANMSSRQSLEAIVKHLESFNEAKG